MGGNRNPYGIKVGYAHVIVIIEGERLYLKQEIGHVDATYLLTLKWRTSAQKVPVHRERRYAPDSNQNDL